MHSQLVVLLVTASGCGRFGFTALDDSGGNTTSDIVADACPLGAWSVPLSATPLNSTDDDWDSAIHPSGSFVVFSRRISGGQYDLYGATITDAQFGSPAPISVLNTSSDDEGPAWSPDGKTLYLISNRTGQFLLHTSEFDGTSFSPPTQLASFTAEVLGPHITNDDLELYYTSTALPSTMGLATRASPTDPWVDRGTIPELTSGASDAFATVSADGLTIYWDSDRDGVRSLWRSTRTQRGAAWGTPVIETPLNAQPALTGDPDLSRDGQLMLFTTSRGGGATAYDLWFARRTCQ